METQTKPVDAPAENPQGTTDPDPPVQFYGQTTRLRLNPTRIAEHVRWLRRELRLTDKIWQALAGLPLEQLKAMEANRPLPPFLLWEAYSATQSAALTMAISEAQFLRNWRRKYGYKPRQASRKTRPARRVK